jgi:methionyl-tRNA formyltransferase
VAFGQILPRWLLELPRLGPVNVHASLLPRYRGAAPIQWAIMNGESESGVTTMLMEESLDTGPILMQRHVPLSDSMTAGELSAKLAEAGAELLLPTLEGLREGTIQPVRQENERATYAPRVTKEMSGIDFGREALGIRNQVRALNPWPLAWGLFRGQRLQVRSARVAAAAPQHNAVAGTFLDCSDDGLLVQCGAGSVIELLEVQLAGRAPVSGRAFANGARLKPGDVPFSTGR